MKPCLKRHKGFTLIELLAVASIIGLLAAVSMISSNRSSHKWQVKEKARQIYLAAKFARINAIEKQRPCSLIVDKVENCFYIEFDAEESDADTQEVAPRSWFKPQELGDKIVVEKFIIGPSSLDEEQPEAKAGIQFLPNGTAKDAMVQIGTGDSHYTITVSASTGRVQFFDKEVDDFVPDQIDLDLQ